MVEDKFLDDPGRYKTQWSSLRNNSLSGAENYPKTLSESFNLLRYCRSPVIHTNPWYGGERKQSTNGNFTHVKGTDQRCELI